MKRQKYYICLLLLLLASSAMAQKVKVSVEGSFNTPQVKSRDTYQVSLNRDYTLGIGSTVDWYFKKNWLLESGISFLQKGGEGATFIGTYDPENANSKEFLFSRIQFKYYTFELPLKIGYDFRLSDDIEVIPTLGLYGGYSFSAGKCDIEYVDPYGNIVQDKWDPFEGYHHGKTLAKLCRFDWGVVSGVKGVLLSHYVFGVNYSHGLKDISTDSGVQFRNENIQIVLGYRF